MEDFEEIPVNNPIRNEILFQLLKNRIIYLDRDINSDTSIIAPQLLLFNKQSTTEPISLWINSNGGDIYNFFAIYDAIQAIEAPVQTVCYGLVASAAAVLLASGTPGMRLIYPNSHVMIHQIQIGEMSGGTGTQLEIEAKEIKRLKNKLSEILARHTRQPMAKIRRDCELDKYLSATDALEYGIVDKIISPVKSIPALRTRVSKKKTPPDAANNPA